MRLLDQTIIVTGSTTGIGKAIAKACIEEGANVLIHGLEEDLGLAAIEDLNPDRSQVSLCVQDLTEPGAPQKVIQCGMDEFGRIDALVNNAAWVTTGKLETTGEALFDKVFFLGEESGPVSGSVLDIEQYPMIGRNPSKG